MKIKAAVVKEVGAPFEIKDDVELHDVGPTDLQIHMVASGICHSDEAIRRGDASLGYPVILGHEGSGIAKKVEDGIEETLAYCDFPSEHWTRIRTNNVIERLNREIRRRTRVVGTFPDGNSALMLVCARLRHVAGTQWGNKKYMNMKHLEAALYDVSVAG